MRFRLWPRTLPVQLIVVVAGAVAISNIGVAFYYYVNSQSQAQNYIIERMVDRAASVAASVSQVQPQARLVVMRTMSVPSWRFREVPENYGSRVMTPDEQALAKRIGDALPAGHPRKTDVVVHLYQPLKDIDPSLRPVRSRQPNPPHDMIQAIVPISNHSAISGVFMRPTPDWPVEIMVAAVIAVLVASAGAAVMAGRVVRPLSELTGAAAAMADGSGRPHVVEQGPDDVRNAAAAFNAMAEKVTRTLESQRHLLSAVGHDLRTPITAMRINLEFIEDSELRDGLMRNLDELQALTEQVLAAARGTGGETKRNVDLSALVESLCADLDDLGEPVHWAGHAAAPISCRPNEIRRALRNVVENAVAYGNKADVRITGNAEGYEIVVEDEGPGIPESDRQRVFEPFVRLESSRNEATGGTGLGLSLVKAIVEGHGGAVVLENRKQGGLRVRMQLPRMPAAQPRPEAA
ncbi:MAG: HAMP domain-containing protein [Alphaproteobacteria bacterium]|nr:HAMP domain-containing protein [Alphaproteobacteria bacterium]